MKEKSYVGMGFYICPVCGVKHSETVLINRLLKDTLETDNFIGYLLCDKDKQLKDDGYIACIEIVGNHVGSNTGISAPRTGAVMHIKDHAWEAVFDQPIPDKGLCFVEEGMVDLIQSKFNVKEVDKDGLSNE